MRVSIKHLDTTKEANAYSVTPVFAGEELGAETQVVDVPDDTYKRWMSMMDQYQAMQQEIREYFIKAGANQ